MSEPIHGDSVLNRNDPLPPPATASEPPQGPREGKPLQTFLVATDEARKSVPGVTLLGLHGAAVIDLPAIFPAAGVVDLIAEGFTVTEITVNMAPQGFRPLPAGARLTDDQSAGPCCYLLPDVGNYRLWQGFDGMRLGVSFSPPMPTPRLTGAERGDRD